MPQSTPKPGIVDSFETNQTKPQQSTSSLDWLEQGFGQRRAQDDAAKKAQQEQEKRQKEQVDKMKQLDKRRSQQMYEEIQQQIQLIRRKKAAQPAKYVTGAAGYDPEKQQKQESFKEKLKRTILPWTSKQGMGTGEITRGVSG